MSPALTSHTQGTSEPRGSSHDARTCGKHIRISRGPTRDSVRHSDWSHRGGHAHTGGSENILYLHYLKKVAAAGCALALQSLVLEYNQRNIW